MKKDSVAMVLLATLDKFLHENNGNYNFYKFKNLLPEMHLKRRFWNSHKIEECKKLNQKMILVKKNY